MNIIKLIEEIAQKSFDIDKFVRIVVEDVCVREEIVNQMAKNSEIMVYYHCYYVVDEASRKFPELFYPYWDEIAKLLHHKNSYHRDFALEIIGNLIKVDHENYFSIIKEDYFSLISDEKFMTGNCCVRNLLKVYQHKSKLRERIIQLLLNIDNICDYTEKQKGVLKADVLAIFDKVYLEIKEREEINDFIKAELHSISPKTRKKANELFKKYNL